MSQDNVVPLRRGGRPLSEDGHIDRIAEDLIDANSLIQAVATFDVTYMRERRDALKRIAAKHRDIDQRLRALRTQAA